jgi:hypothetical protein
MPFDATARPKTTTIAPPAAKKAPNTGASAMAKANERSKEERHHKRQEGLEGYGQMATIALLGTGQFADAGAVSLHWPKIADETANVAEAYEGFGSIIDKLVASGPIAALLLAAAPLFLQWAVNHDRLGAHPIMAQFGVLPKETVAMQGEAEALRLARMALEAQQQAARELAEAQAAMARENGSQPQQEPAYT